MINSTIGVWSEVQRFLSSLMRLVESTIRLLIGSYPYLFDELSQLQTPRQFLDHLT